MSMYIWVFVSYLKQNQLRLKHLRDTLIHNFAFKDNVSFTLILI